LPPYKCICSPKPEKSGYGPEAVTRHTLVNANHLATVRAVLHVCPVVDIVPDAFNSEKARTVRRVWASCS